MNITLNTTHLRPATMAAMIADLMDSPVYNSYAIKTLLKQLETSVGEEGTAEFLSDVGLVPGRAALEWKVA